MVRLNLFESVLLIVWLLMAFMGYRMINELYKADQGQISWEMLISVFTWLSLLVLLILAGLMIDSRNQGQKKVERIF